MDGELLCEIIQGKERVTSVEAFLILAVAALHLAIVTRRIRSNELMPNLQLGGRFFKQRRQITFAV